MRNSVYEQVGVSTDDEYYYTQTYDDDETGSHVSLGYGLEQITSNKEDDIFTFKDVKYSINDKKILKGISGSIKKGELVGILGHSGAGKSTLLNALSGRLTYSKGKLSGNFCVNGEKITNASQLKNMCGYVTQRDNLYPTSTARECIEFSAQLRLPQDIPNKIKQQSVESVLSALRLLHCQDRQIGKTTNLSGGEAKRISIGIELVTNPQLLFLDEPTSGLDAHTALKIMKILKNLTKNQDKQIITTIHQPSKEIFSMFDKIMLVCQGQCVYFGNATNIVEYFQLLGYNCPTMVNLADFLIISIQNDPEFFISAWNKFQSQMDPMEGYTQNYDKNLVRDTINAKVIDDTSQSPTPSIQVLKKEKTLTLNNVPSASFFKQLWLLMVRDIVGIYRKPLDLWSRILSIAIGVGSLTLLFWDLPNTMRGAQDLSSMLYYINCASLVVGIINTFKFIPQYRVLMEHERASKTYSTTAWILSKLLLMSTLIAIESFIYAFLATYGAFHSTWSWEITRKFYIVMFLVSSATCGFSMIICCFAEDLMQAVQGPPMFTSMMLLNNLSCDMSRQFKFIQWMKDTNYMSYSLNALMHVSFEGRVVEINAFMSETGEEYLNYLGIPEDSFQTDLCFIAGAFVSMWMISAIILLRRNGW